MQGSIYEVAGGMDAMRRLAQRWHALALVDPLLSHPFSHGYAEDHVERLATYLAQALGGPPAYTERFGPAAQVDRLHAGNGSHEDLNQAAVTVFSRAVDTAEIPEPAAQALKDYWEWATFTVMDEFPDSADDVPADRPVHTYTWDGPAAPEA
ncbi:oxidoreductase [Brachybacterium sp. FME24]|uniref:globin domain-containing protein n=1 Tax=Brachybacterium sp. FME24 TaxID=2742605 RepID=UPI001865C051|nr:oxidoreductase [Brachybacterium sp. FME24]